MGLEALATRRQRRARFEAWRMVHPTRRQAQLLGGTRRPTRFGFLCRDASLGSWAGPARGRARLDPAALTGRSCQLVALLGGPVVRTIIVASPWESRGGRRSRRACDEK